ncbi:MAG: sigma-70 family RNA polymerase sigma factor [Clostridia bacterium]|nr:sigma-70 family RNA polymerase sigma factor [Clostridia bacterium]
MEEARTRRALLLRAAKGGDRAAMEAFYEENQGLIRMVTARFLGRDAEYEDLFQVACMAFVKAVSGFDLEAGMQFSTYAVPVMLGELRRYFRDNGAIRVSRTIKEQARRLSALREELSGTLGREPTIGELADRAGMEREAAALALDSLLPVLSLSGGIEEEGLPLLERLGEDLTESMEDRAAVRMALEKLPERQRKLVLLRYCRSKTQQETAALLGISQVQVSRLERRALEALRTLLASS